MTMIRDLPDRSATEAFAARVERAARVGDAILLSGPLGAGKTAFCRAFLRAATGDAALVVPSPSCTLVQTYETPRLRAHHFDLGVWTGRMHWLNCCGRTRWQTSCWSNGRSGWAICSRCRCRSGTAVFCRSFG
jgi:hypothetical protein